MGAGVERISNAVNRVLFGPKIEGVIEDIAVDPKASVTHILVDTSGGLRHIIHPNTEIGISLRDGSVSVHDFTKTRIGDSFLGRVRGKGVVFFPWSKVTRDPFRKTAA